MNAVEIAKRWVASTPENVPHYIPVALSQREMRALCEAVLEAEDIISKAEFSAVVATHPVVEKRCKDWLQKHAGEKS